MADPAEDLPCTGGSASTNLGTVVTPAPSVGAPPADVGVVVCSALVDGVVAPAVTVLADVRRVDVAGVAFVAPGVVGAGSVPPRGPTGEGVVGAGEVERVVGVGEGELPPVDDVLWARTESGLNGGRPEPVVPARSVPPKIQASTSPGFGT